MHCDKIFISDPILRRVNLEIRLLGPGRSRTTTIVWVVFGCFQENGVTFTLGLRGDF